VSDTATTTEPAEQSAPDASSKTRSARVGKVVSTGRLDYTRAQRMMIGAVSVISFFLVWESATRFGDINPIFLPTLSSVRDAIIASYESGALMPNVYSSVRMFVACMALSVAIAVPLGIVVGAVDALNRTFATWFWTIYTSPRIIFIPLILIWFGYTTTAKVVIIVISAVPPMVVMIMEGVKTVDGSMLRAARSYGAARTTQLRKVVLPGTLPYVGTGIRMGVARGLVGLFGAELFTGRDGLGFLLADAGKRYNIPLVFGTLGIYLVMCMVMVSASATAEKRLSRWRD
jgi:NitT/TauT family transport system permease protein